VQDLKIKIPKSVFLEQDSESWEDLLKDLTFPVIVKPRVSSIVAHSHDLFIVRDKEALLEVIEQNPYLKEDSIIV
jgi:glutathione synthase/RimK-type ligase-like ATP-grasp enzyme